MGLVATYSREKCASGKTNPTPKNRVWGNFENPNETRLANRRQPLKTRLENTPCTQKTASGVLYYGYRYYDPVTGRWPSRDPIEERGGVNLYGFVGNDSLVSIDYLGFEILAMSYARVTGTHTEYVYESHQWDIYASVDVKFEGYVKASGSYEVSAQAGVNIFGSGATTKITGKIETGAGFVISINKSWDVLQLNFNQAEYSVKDYSVKVCVSNDGSANEQLSLTPKELSTILQGHDSQGSITEEVNVGPGLDINVRRLKDVPPMATLISSNSSYSTYNVTFSDWGDVVDTKLIPVNMFTVVNSGGDVNDKLHSGYYGSGLSALGGVGSAAKDFMNGLIGR